MGMKVDLVMIVSIINLQCIQNPVGGNSFSYEIFPSTNFPFPQCRLAAAGGLELLPCSLLHVAKWRCGQDSKTGTAYLVQVSWGPTGNKHNMMKLVNNTILK